MVIDKRNHHIEKAGVKLRIPLVKNKLRVEVCSYVMLAIENKQDEHNPWAIIIIKAPCQPHELQIITPRTTRAMWPIDE